MQKINPASRFPLVTLCLLLLFSSSEVGGQDGQTPGGGRDPGGLVLDPGNGETDDEYNHFFELCCRPLGPTLDQAWHCFTRTTRQFPDGRVHDTRACRAGPTGLLRDYPQVPDENDVPQNDGADCPDWNIFDGAWGPIDTYCGPWEEGHPDFPKDRKDWEQLQCELIWMAGSEGEGLYDCIENVMRCIQQCCVRYEALGGDLPPLDGRNSNSSAHTALSRCLPIEVFLLEGGPLLGAPGWDQLVDCPCVNDCLDPINATWP